MEDRRKTLNDSQNIILKNREKIIISGILDIENFNEEIIVVTTVDGLLIIRGMDMRIDRLDTENSQLDAHGRIFSIEYDDGMQVQKEGFLSKLFG